MAKVKESTKYESLLGVKVELPQSATLEDFVEVTDADEANPNQWQKHWHGMPQFQQEDDKPYKSVIINFKTKQDYENFAKTINQPLTEKTKSTWFPRLPHEDNALHRWIEE